VTVSIIVAVRDGERYLAAALQSLLDQERPPDELIVADDGSTDGSAAIAAEHGARVLRLPARGPAAARNAGVQAATGELIGFLDADDLAHPKRLALQVDALEEPAFDHVIGHVQNFLTPERAAALHGRVAFAGEPRPGWVVGAMLMRRAAFTPFDESLNGGETVEWLSRLESSRVRVLDEIVLLRRVHGDNTTLQDASWRASYLEVTRRAIARSREAPA
jgi:glycosyltransferase involved in cell wall biosynthesis